MTQVGVALALTVALTGIAHFLGGELCDLRGPKVVMGSALIMRGVGSAAMAWAMWHSWPAWTIVALNAAAVFGGNFYEPGVRSWIAESVPASERLATYGWLRVALNIGWALGPAVGGIVAEHSYPLLFIMTAVICWICATIIILSFSHVAPSRAEDRLSVFAILGVARDLRFVEFCFYSMLIAIVMGQLVVSLSVHCVGFLGFSKREVGWLFSLNGLVVIGVQTAATVLMRRFRFSVALAVGSVLYAVGYACVGFSHVFSSMAIAVVVITLGEVIVSPGLPSLATNLAPLRHRGRYVGFHGLCFQTGSSLAPFLGGIWLEHLSPSWGSGPWIIIACVGFLASFGFLRLGRLLKPPEDSVHGCAPVPEETPLAL